MSSKVETLASPFNSEWKMLRITSPNGKSQCDVHLHGAHLTSYRCTSPNSSETLNDEVIFVSEKAIFATDKAIRGGVPICFPQFSDKGPLSMSHGFARNVLWEVVDQKIGSLESVGTLKMIKSGAYRGQNKDIAKMMADYDGLDVFLIVSLTDNHLDMSLKVVDATNGQSANWDVISSFTFAFHNYFRIGDIRKAHIDGVHNNHHHVQYVDKINKSATIIAPSEPIVISEEVDRVYLDMLDDIRSVIVDESGDSHTTREIHIDQQANTAQNVVVWNLWQEKCKKMADMKPEDYEKFVCVEVGQIQTPIKLEKGGEFVATQRIYSAYKNNSKL